MQRLIKSYEKKFPLEKEVYQSILHTNIFDQLETDDDKLSYLNLLNDYYPETYVEWFKNLFGENFYIELNPNDMSMQWVREEKRHVHTGSNPQDRVNKKLVELSLKFNVKIVLVQDSYIPDKDQHIIQSIQIMNSPGGKDGWYFYEAPEIMDIATMYEKTITNYDWITDAQFVEWCNNSYEILLKCKDCELEFQPSLPIIKYEDHYVNKVPTVIKRSLILALQEIGKWDEDVKDRIIKNKNIKEEPVPDWLKEKFNTDEKCIDFDDMEKRVKENVFLEETLIKMKTHFKKEKDFLRLIIRSEKDLAMRTALKVMMRYQKLLPKTVDEDRLAAEIEKRTPGKKREDFKKEAIDKFIMKMNLYKVSNDPMLLLGDKITRDRLLEECNTIQYNGILRLIGYFMLLEDVTNFVNENNYLRGFGRGSGAGSIVAYALDITDCQPIENGLLFERFLTTERIGEKEYELEGFSLKEFMKKKNQSRIEISQEDLIISDDDLDDLGMGEDLIEDGE
jgi:DNA polymerase III alpha subunit